jgi:UDP:flavonoid glycosyltransferase YjiC (YdhE family)
MPTPDEFVGSVLAAATTLKRRVVLCGAFTSDLRDKAPPHAIVLDDEPPLEWLLTRCRGAVLCGEPARVGVALTVGCPVIALPVTTTQRFVAARLVALGVPAAAGQSDGVLMLKDANATAITGERTR